jgi:hypothetical protein
MRDLKRFIVANPLGKKPGADTGGSLRPGREPATRLRREGKLFMNDSGIFWPNFASLLTIASKPENVRDALIQWAIDTGFNGFRVFAGALPWANQTPEMARENLPDLVALADAANMYVEITALTDTKQGYDKRAHLREIADLCARFDNTLLEIANEPYHDTQDKETHDFNYLLRLRRELVPPFVMTSLGAPNYDEPQDGKWPIPVADYQTVHIGRGRDPWDNVRHVRELEAVLAKANCPVMDNERIGADENARRGSRENNPAIFFGYGVMDRLFNVGQVHHSQHGLMGELPGSVQQACAEAAVRGYNIVRTRTPLTYKNTGWADSPVASANFNNVVRVYCGLDPSGSEHIMALVGLKGDPELRMQGGWQVGEVIGEMPEIRVHRLVH